MRRARSAARQCTPPGRGPLGRRALTSSGSRARDELREHLARNPTAPGKRFSLLVGPGKPIGRMTRLDRLGEHLPVQIEVLASRCRSASSLSRPRLAGRVTDQTVPERDADVAQHGRIGEIALQREIGSFSEKCRRTRSANPRFPLGVLEVRSGSLLCASSTSPPRPRPRAA